MGHHLVFADEGTERFDHPANLIGGVYQFVKGLLRFPGNQGGVVAGEFRNYRKSIAFRR